MFKSFVFTAAALGALLASSGAEAGSWAFRRSYYSHDPVNAVEIGRSPASGPFYTRPRGEYVRSGYRHLHSHIHIGGHSYDHLNVYESWVQYGSQR